MMLKVVVDCIFTKPFILFLFACMTTPEKYCLIDSSVGAISIALVTGFCPGFSQFKIEILGWAARRTVAKRLKYNEISFVLS